MNACGYKNIRDDLSKWHVLRVCWCINQLEPRCEGQLQCSLLSYSKSSSASYWQNWYFDYTAIIMSCHQCRNLELFVFCFVHCYSRSPYIVQIERSFPIVKTDKILLMLVSRVVPVQNLIFCKTRQASLFTVTSLTEKRRRQSIIFVSSLNVKHRENTVFRSYVDCRRANCI